MKKCTFLLFLCFAFFSSTAQNTNILGDRACFNCPDDEPTASAVVEMKSNNKGLIIPRVADTSAVLNPAVGVLIYDNSDHTFKYYNGSVWTTYGGGGRKVIMGHGNQVLARHSMALGYRNEALGFRNSSIGVSNTVVSDSSSAFGYFNSIPFSFSISATAIGNRNEVSGARTSAVGYKNTVTVQSSSAFGYENNATGAESSAFGSNNTASGGGGCNAFGRFNSSLGFQSNAFGTGNLSDAHFSNAFGHSLDARIYQMTAIGTNNATVSGSTTDWIPSQPVFMVGNGENNANRSTALTILKNGNTGIGTMTPTDALLVVASAEYDDNVTENIAIFSKLSTATAYTNIKLIANGHAGIKFIDEGDGSSAESDFMIKMSSTGELEIRNADNADDEFATSDLVSEFATLSDIYQFTVYGDALASSGVWQNSDRRLKKNIKNLDDALGTIMKLQPKRYDFDTKNTKFQYLNLSETPQIGLMAQDVEKVLPELVKTDLGNEPNTDADEQENETTIQKIKDLKAINYTALIPVLIGAIQEQQNEITAYQSRIERKEKRIEKLEERLNNIEKLLTQNSQIQHSKVLLTDDMTIEKPQLYQNQPNPFSKQTVIPYFIPKEVQQAHLQIHDVDGKILKVIELYHVGKGQVELETHQMINGNYSYSLILDGQLFETKQMVLVR